VGLLTREPGIVEAALDRLGADGEEHHVLVHTCPEHAVDVYRGRVEGVKMAWQLGEQSAIPPRRSLSATSASRA
jgi:hypothetical protein